MSDDPKISLLPLSPDEAHSYAQERVAQLGAAIEAEQQAFVERRARILAARPRDWAAEEDQRAELRQAEREFNGRVYPMRQEREYILMALARLEIPAPLKFNWPSVH